MTADVGLLILRGTRSAIEHQVVSDNLLRLASERVYRRLYVHLDVCPSSEAEENDEISADFQALVSSIYMKSASINARDEDQPALDVRVLLGRRRSLAVDRVFQKSPTKELAETVQDGPFHLDSVCCARFLSAMAEKKYNSVALGGTFDRIHGGHKVLLSAAALLSRKVVCGVTDKHMIKMEERCKVVEEFIRDVSDDVETEIVPISDPFGPAIIMPNLDCIVVSPETVKGALAINDERKKRSLNQLVVHTIELVAGHDLILNETKLSSSAMRRAALGSILREPSPTTQKLLPEANIYRYFPDCDKIAHLIYAESAELRDQLCKAFGPEIIHDNDINRKVLASIVFRDESQRQVLNSIVWPAVTNKIKNIIISSLPNDKVFVLDAALLLEANWDGFLNQVWTTFVPRDEAVKRICVRDKLSVEQAEKRVDSQMTNEQRIAKSNVVFCTLWQYEETERQVDKAVRILRSKYLSGYQVLELNGVLDAESVRQAARNGQITVRNASGSDPLVQVGSSVYSGQWTQTLGTDMIFCSSSPATAIEGNMPGNSFVATEQPEPTSTLCNTTPGGHTSTTELLAISQTRLMANKALITMDSGVKAPVPDSQTVPATAESKEILDALTTEESTSKSSEKVSSGKTEDKDKGTKKGRYANKKYVYRCAKSQHFMCFVFLLILSSSRRLINSYQLKSVLGQLCFVYVNIDLLFYTHKTERFATSTAIRSSAF
ncbi:dephospho-CoA kinase domain-containing protein [Ditylenchus destructor]|nr:dephospho-CoA kinase domain-containing protein [Ditylenchus destructor]